jgi:hypothetical protein
MRRLTVHPAGWTCSECGPFTWASDPYHHLAIHRDLSRVDIDIHLEVFIPKSGSA